MWDPRQYRGYADQRARPFHDLMARVAAPEAAVVVDLGCGDGSLTALLAERWPSASVLGVDASSDMLAAAARHRIPDRLAFRSGVIESWHPDRPVDVLVSNAALHWVPEHPALLERFAAALSPGGWLAFQVPGNFTAPSHTILADLRRSPRWREQLAAGAVRAPVLDPGQYLALLERLGCRVDAWETTYLHVLPGPDPVLEWVRGTALRPVLAALGPAGAAEFEHEYGARLRDAYPAGAHGTVFPFRRIFVVAQQPTPPITVARGVTR